MCEIYAMKLILPCKICAVKLSEEELKRLHASIAQDKPGGGAEVGYNYEEETEEQYDPTEPTNDDDSMQKLFTAPSLLAVPKDMEIVISCFFYLTNM